MSIFFLFPIICLLTRCVEVNGVVNQPVIDSCYRILLISTSPTVSVAHASLLRYQFHTSFFHVVVFIFCCSLPCFLTQVTNVLSRIVSDTVYFSMCLSLPPIKNTHPPPLLWVKSWQNLTRAYMSPTTKRANPSSGNWLLRSHVKTRICRFFSSVCFGQWSDKKLCAGSSGCCLASKKRCEKQNELENRLTRISIVVPKSSSFVLQPDMGCPNFTKQQQRDEMKWAEKKRLWKDFNKSEWILVFGQSVTRWHSPFPFSLNSLFSFFINFHRMKRRDRFDAAYCCRKFFGPSIQQLAQKTVRFHTFFDNKWRVTTSRVSIKMLNSKINFIFIHFLPYRQKRSETCVWYFFMRSEFMSWYMKWNICNVSDFFSSSSATLLSFRHIRDEGAGKKGRANNEGRQRQHIGRNIFPIFSSHTWPSGVDDHQNKSSLCPRKSRQDLNNIELARKLSDPSHVSHIDDICWSYLKMLGRFEVSIGSRAPTSTHELINRKLHSSFIVSRTFLYLCWAEVFPCDEIDCGLMATFCWAWVLPLLHK